MEKMLPLLALIALGLVVMSSGSPSKKLVEEQVPGGHSLTRPTGPSQMWVDRAVNTVLRNDAKGETPAEIDRYLKRTYASEVDCHPGVTMLAGQRLHMMS